MALPNDILSTIGDLRRRLRNLESNPQPPSITLSETGTASFDLAAAGDASHNDVYLITAELTELDDKRLLVMPTFSIYKTSVGVANLWPFGANWTIAEQRNLFITTWMDWGETDNNNAVFKILLQNKHTAAITGLLLKINFRYQMREASL
jgi:hypothetical protein